MISASAFGPFDAGGVAIVIAFGAVAVSAVALWVTFGQKREETLVTTLAWMEGGTQKRAIGIAAIEYWLSLSQKQALTRLPTKSRVLVIRVLLSTAVYLLTSSKQAGSVQELDNLSRIMTILLHGVDPANVHYRDRFPLLLRVVQEARLPDPIAADDRRLQVRELDRSEWEKVLREIVSGHSALS